MKEKMTFKSLLHCVYMFEICQLIDRFYLFIKFRFTVKIRKTLPANKVVIKTLQCKFRQNFVIYFPLTTVSILGLYVVKATPKQLSC